MYVCEASDGGTKCSNLKEVLANAYFYRKYADANMLCYEQCDNSEFFKTSETSYNFCRTASSCSD